MIPSNLCFVLSHIRPDLRTIGAMTHRKLYADSSAAASTSHQLQTTHDSCEMCFALNAPNPSQSTIK